MQIACMQDFAGAAHETFTLAMGAASLDVTLVEVKPLPVQAYPGRLREPFSLTFRNASPVILPQKIYNLKNQALGSLDIFLVPVGRDAGGVLYQAIFN